MATSETGYLAHLLVEFEKESICMSWELNERQKGRGGKRRNKTSLHSPMNKSSYEWPLKNK